MPLYHSSASVLAAITAVKFRSTVAIGRKFSVSTFWDDVRSSRATIVQYVGETFRYLLSAPPSPKDKEHSVRLAYGNGLRPDVWDVFKERFGVPVIVEFYSATEAPSLLINVSANSFSSGAVGHHGLLIGMLLGSAVFIAEYDHETNTLLRNPQTGLLQPVKPGQPGELLFKLDPKSIETKYQGYFNNEKATSSKVVRDVRTKGDAYFSTGDVIRWDKEGRVWFMDRIGDTFRWRSENVSTAEVSEVLGRCPGIAEANVYGVLVPRHDGRAGCAAIVTTDADSRPNSRPTPSPALLKAIAAHAKANLPRYAVPLFLRFTASMHRTGTNKQQKHILREQGVDVDKVEAAGDELYWLHPQTAEYVPFSKTDLKGIEEGKAKL
jgi:acyl-CoA synthetase (AMP-forming)/AMP-acid ligase II